jgi:hypothetical protein
LKGYKLHPVVSVSKYADAGESILICKPNEKNAAKSLASSELPPVKSCLFGGAESTSLSSSMKRAILEVCFEFILFFPMVS